jgi:preprotein translocase subunit SecA
MLEKQAERIVMSCFQPEHRKHDVEEAIRMLEQIIPEAKIDFDQNNFNKAKDEESKIDYLKTYLLEKYQNREDQLTDAQILRQIEKSISLSVIDTHWMEHIDAMQELRESVSLRGYGQKDPLIEYKDIGFQQFKELLAKISHDTINSLFKIDLAKSLPAHLLKTSAVNSDLITNSDQIEDALQTHLTSAAGWTLPNSASEEWQNEAINGNVDESWEQETENQEQPIIKIRADQQNTKPLILGQDQVKQGRLPCADLGRNDICPVCNVKAKKCPQQ